MIQHDISLDNASIAAWRQRIRETTFANYHLHMGISFEATGDFPAALTAFQRAIDADPKCFEAYLKLEEVATALQQQSIAVTALQQAEHITPAFRGLGLLRLALVYAQARKWNQAKSMVSAIDLEDPHVMRALPASEVLECAELFEANDVMEAMTLARFVSKTIYEEINSENVDINIRTAHIFFRSHKYETSLPLYKSHVKFSHKDADAWFRIGYIEFIIGNYESAIENLKRSVQLEQGESYALGGLGMALLASGNSAEAERILSQAIQEGRHAAYLYSFRGIALQALGQRPQAIESYKRACELAPSPQTFNALIDHEQRVYLGAPCQAGFLALGKLADGQLEDALALVEKSLKQLPENCFDLIVYGLIKQKMGTERDFTSAMKTAQTGKQSWIFPATSKIIDCCNRDLT